VRIGVLSKRTGLKPTAIRFYEANGVLPPPTRLSSGYRDYTAEDEERIQFLMRLRRVGLSVADLRSLVTLRDDPHHADPSALTAARRAVAAVDEHLDDLIRVREQLGDAGADPPPEFATE